MIPGSTNSFSPQLSGANGMNAQAMDQQLNFYRFKMTQHEQERIEWQEQAEIARHNIETVHSMES